MTIRYPVQDPPQTGEVIALAAGILWFRLPLPMALDHVNIYALEDETGWCLIDTGFFSKRSVKLWRELLEGPLAGKPVSRVIVTHHHPDHIGMAGWFQTQFGAELLTSRTAWLMARMLQLDPQQRPDDKTVAFWKRAGMDADVLQTRMQERPFNFADCVHPLPLGYRRIVQDEVLSIGGRQWKVHLGGGHAPDHVTLWSQKDGLVISADQVIASISPNIGVYATEPMADPLRDWLESCERFHAMAEDDMLTLPGHKMPFYGLKTRLAHLIENHEQVLVRLRQEIKTPKSARECFDAIFKRPIKPGEYGLALVEAVAHLNHLYHRQEARIEDQGDLRRFVAV